MTHVNDEEIDWIIVKKDGNPASFLDDPKYLEKNKDKFEVYTSKSNDILLSNAPDLDYHKFEFIDDGSCFTIWRKLW